MAKMLGLDSYTVGWVCALPVELAAAKKMLDEQHKTPPYNAHDTNLYSCGRIGEHNVVIACLPGGQTGTNSAAAVAAQMKSTFSSTRFGLMVGIGGGVPGEDADVRLGDVVVSRPYHTHGGVVQYDLGKATTGGGFERTGALNTPPTVLLNAVANLQANQMLGESRLSEYLSKLESLPDFSREAAGSDKLFEADYEHTGKGATCLKCSTERTVPREARTQQVVVHHGTIASGNQVIKDAALRDKLSEDLGGVLCFEMEAAGLMNSFPCLVVRGVCDYADSHKNKRWQPYAAGTAAAYAKEILSVIPAADVARSRTAEETMRDATPTYYIPFKENKRFVGRRDELAMLQQRLLVESDCQEMSIEGLGGTGKTQVALQFAYAVKKAQPEWSIFWAPAVSMESFEQACAEIARALHIPQAADSKDDVKELVKTRLSSSRAGRWLMVVDNADDPDVFFGTEQSKGIVDYLPESERGVTVYTTRTPEVAEKTHGDVIRLEAMSRQDARDFFTNSLGKKRSRQHEPTSTKLLDELLDELTCLPLAIAQAAAYLNRNRMPITKYLQLLRNTEQDLVNVTNREFRDDTRYRNSANAVATTWVVSFSQIRKQNELAASLLEFMSVVEWKAIPRSLLPSVQSQAEMEEAIGTLCGYSFLARRDSDDQATSGESKQGGRADELPEADELYDIHRLVHLATKIWVQQYGNVSGVTEEAIRHVADVFPRSDWKNRTAWRAYLPHAMHLLAAEYDGHDKQEKPGLCSRIGRCLHMDGRTKEAVIWLEKSCRLRSNLEHDDPDLLSSQHYLAMAYKANGQVKESVQLLEAVVKAEEILDADHPDRLASQHALAMAYRADGQVKKAVQLLEAVVKAKEMLDADHPDQLASQHELASAYHADGQTKKAVQLLEAVVKANEMLDSDHPNRLVSQQTLATVYQADGQVKKAMELLEHVVEMQKSLQPDHPDLLASQHELAGAYLADGQVKKAIELLEHVVKIRMSLQADHPDLLASQHELAGTYLADKQIKRAIELLEHVVEMQKSLQPDHPDLLASQHELARAYDADGQVEKAITLLERVVAIEAKIFRDDHPSQLVSVKMLADMYARSGFSPAADT